MYRHLTDEQLLEKQKSLGLALDRALDSKRRTRGIEAQNIRRRLWRVMDEQDRRRKQPCATTGI
jgi:hypothetical protein